MRNDVWVCEACDKWVETYHYLWDTPNLKFDVGGCEVCAECYEDILANSAGVTAEVE